MDDELTQSISQAIERLNLSAARVPDADAEAIVAEAQRRYVRGSPRAWWMSFALPAERFDSTKRGLLEVTPEKAGRCWLVAEVDKGSSPVFDINLQDVQAVLDECPYFEYYLIRGDFSWLVAESDHNQFYVCRAKENSATPSGSARQ